MDKPRINSNCVHIFSRKYLPSAYKNVNATLPCVFLRIYITAMENVKINSRAIFQWKRFHANIRANNIWQNVSWRINAVPDSSNIAPRRVSPTSHALRTRKAFIPTVKPINYRAWATTLFCAPGNLLMRNRREGRTMATREINFQFVGLGGGEGGTRSKVHSASCHVPRSDTHETKGHFLGCVSRPDAERRLSEGKIGDLSSHVLEKRELEIATLRTSWISERTNNNARKSIISLFPPDSLFD